MSSAGIAASSRETNDWDTSRNPVTRMFTPTIAATIGSSRCQPVRPTRSTPTMTPADVQTSVSRCLPSADSVTERWAVPARSSSMPAARFTPVARVEIPSPSPMLSSAAGCRKRSTALTRMTPAATKIISPSIPAEKYSALPCPKLWLSSAGRAATCSAISATTAATRLTTDSAASERSPTDPVSRYAPDFSAIVTTAAEIDSHANFVNPGNAPCCSTPTCGKAIFLIRVRLPQLGWVPATGTFPGARVSFGWVRGMNNRRTRGCSASAREDHARVEQQPRVQRCLDRSHRRDLGGGAREVQPLRLGAAHPVLGADAPAQRCDIPQHRVGHGMVVVRVEHVDVKVALVKVAEDDRPGSRGDLRDHPGQLLQGALELRMGDCHVELDRHADGVDRLGLRLAVAPQTGPAARILTHHDVDQARHQLVDLLEGLQHRLAGVDAVGTLHEQVCRVVTGDGRGQAGMPHDQCQAVSKEQLGGLERAQPGPEPDKRLERRAG